MALVGKVVGGQGGQSGELSAGRGRRAGMGWWFLFLFDYLILNLVFISSGCIYFVLN